MTQKGFAPIFIVLFVVILFALGIWYYLNSQGYYSNLTGWSAQFNPKSESKPDESTKPANSDPLKSTLEGLQKALNVKSPITESKNVDFYDADKKRIPYSGLAFGLATEANDYVGKYGNFKAQDVSAITEDSLKILREDTDKFFISNGFEKDTKNSYKVDDPIIFERLGYVKESFHCLVTYSYGGDPFGQFFCGTLDQTQIEWRKELASAVNPKNDPKTVFRVDTLKENFAQGGIGQEAGVGGAAWYAVKVDGKWKKVWEGQNLVSCKIVDQYKMRDFLGNGDGVCSTDY